MRRIDGHGPVYYQFEQWATSDVLTHGVFTRLGGVSQAPSSAMADEDLVNTLAQYMELEPLEKQALLEREGTLARCRLPTLSRRPFSVSGFAHWNLLPLIRGLSCRLPTGRFLPRGRRASSPLRQGLRWP